MSSKSQIPIRCFVRLLHRTRVIPQPSATLQWSVSAPEVTRMVLIALFIYLRCRLMQVSVFHLFSLSNSHGGAGRSTTRRTRSCVRSGGRTRGSWRPGSGRSLPGASSSRRRRPPGMGSSALYSLFSLQQNPHAFIALGGPYNLGPIITIHQLLDPYLHVLL